jgi:hypothetical protein
MLSEEQYSAIDYCDDCGCALYHMEGAYRWAVNYCPYSGSTHRVRMWYLMPEKEEDEMREIVKYYYCRDDASRPITTVCLLKANGDVARGLAICSNDDNPCKKTGRKISRDRAVFAMKTKTNSCAILTLRAWFCVAMGVGRFKSAYNPPLTQLENKLLYGEVT